MGFTNCAAQHTLCPETLHSDKENNPQGKKPREEQQKMNGDILMWKLSD